MIRYFLGNFLGLALAGLTQAGEVTSEAWPGIEGALRAQIPEIFAAETKVETIQDLSQNGQEPRVLVRTSIARTAEHRGRAHAIVCRFTRATADWSCGQPLAHEYLYWPRQTKPIHLNTGVEPALALRALDFFASMATVESNEGTMIPRGELTVEGLSNTARGDLMIDLAGARDRRARLFLRSNGEKFTLIPAATYRQHVPYLK